MGLFSIDQDRRIIIPDIVANIPENEILLDIRGLPIREANDNSLFISYDAIQWHRENIPRPRIASPHNTSYGQIG